MPDLIYIVFISHFIPRCHVKIEESEKEETSQTYFSKNHRKWFLIFSFNPQFLDECSFSNLLEKKIGPEFSDAGLKRTNLVLIAIWRQACVPLNVILRRMSVDKIFYYLFCLGLAVIAFITQQIEFHIRIKSSGK